MNTPTSRSRAVTTLLILALGLGSTPVYAMRQEQGVQGAGAEEIEAVLQQPSRGGLEEGKAPSVALGDLRRQLYRLPRDAAVTLQFDGLPGGVLRRVFDSPAKAVSDAYKRLTWLPVAARVQSTYLPENIVTVTVTTPTPLRTYPGNRSPGYLSTALMYLRLESSGVDGHFLDDGSVVSVSAGALRRGVDLSVEQIVDLLGIQQEGEKLTEGSVFLIGHCGRIAKVVAKTVEARDALVDINQAPLFQPITVDDVTQGWRGLKEPWARGYESTIQAYIARVLTLSGLSAETMTPRAAVRRSDLVQPPRVFYHRDVPAPRVARGEVAVSFSADPSQGVAELTAAGITTGDVILLPETIAPGTEHQWRVLGIETPILVLPATGITDLTDQEVAALLAVAKHLSGQILRITPQTWSTRIVNDQYFSIQY